MDVGDVAKDAEDVADGDHAAGGDVVGEAGPAAFQQEGVGPHDVADVGEVAALVEVADADDGFGAVGDGGDLGGEGGGDEIRGLSGADVVGRAGDHDVEAVVGGVQKGGVVGGGFGDAVDVVGTIGGVLGEGLGRGMGTVDFGGGDDEDARGREFLADGVEEIQGADRVDGKDVLGLGPPGGDEGDAAEVQNGGRAGFFQDRRDGIEVADVHFQAGKGGGGHAGDVAADDLVAGVPQGGDGVPSRESVASGDEDFHEEEFGIRNSGFRMETKTSEHPYGADDLIF